MIAIKDYNGKVLTQVSNLRGANLSDADLRGANLRGANLSDADLRGANLRDANLRDANLRDANLRGANLRDANLRDANLSDANLSDADLSDANLSDADLRDANLSDADLRGANLRDADLRGANLSDANLSGAKGLLSPQAFLTQFPSDDLGIIVIKAISKTNYKPPNHWKMEAGQFLTEECHSDRCLNCSCGVNFGTLEFVTKMYSSSDHWRCRIRWEDLCGVVVPYNTDGKARCNRLELLERIK